MITNLAAGTLAKIAGIGLVLAVAAAGVQTYRLAGEQRDHAETRTKHAEQVAELERVARQAEASARETERRWSAAMEDVTNEHRARIDQARADADAAASAGERLRQRVAELAAGCRGPTGGASAANDGETAGATARVLADVQRRLDEAADRIARHADEARSAGLACERAYGAVSDVRGRVQGDAPSAR